MNRAAWSSRAKMIPLNFTNCSARRTRFISRIKLFSATPAQLNRLPKLWPRKIPRRHLSAPATRANHRLVMQKFYDNNYVDNLSDCETRYGGIARIRGKGGLE